MSQQYDDDHRRRFTTNSNVNIFTGLFLRKLGLFAALLFATGANGACTAWPAAAAALLGGGGDGGGGALLLFPGGGAGPATGEGAEEGSTVSSEIDVVTTSPAGNYRAGDVLLIRVTFPEAVDVTGTPRLALNNGIVINYDSGSGTDQILFRYTIGPGDDVSALDYASSTAISLAGGTINLQSSGDPADLTLSTPGETGSISANQIIGIDTIAPIVTNVTSTNADGAYGAGTLIAATVQFSEAVSVSGTPTLDLNTAPARSASYTSGSGTDTLTFHYTVNGGDTAADLDEASTAALAGGTIRDDAANPAMLTLPVPGATGSLGLNKDIEINTTLPTFSLGLASGSSLENGGAIVIPVNLSAPSASTATVQYNVPGGSASAADYSLSSGTLVFAPGETSKNITLNIVDDTLDEDAETVNVAISSPVGAGLGTPFTYVHTINDNDAAPGVILGVSGSPFSENGGVATVTATLSTASGKNVTVNLAYSGTAANTTDYTRSGAAIVIPAGSTSGSVTLTGVNDALDENDETVIVDIASVTNGTESGTQQVTATVADDDAPPTVTLGVTGSPFAENGGSATVTATLSSASAKSVTVNLGYSGTATNTSDYTRSGASIVIAAGATSGSVSLTGVNDATTEGDETVIVDIASIINGTESGTQQVTATISDDDTPTVTLGLSGSPLAENGGVATVTATLSGTAPFPITVNLAYTGTATNATDYNASTAAIVIAAGNLSGTATITGVDDGTDENDETVIVDIDSVVNANESGTQQVTATITDDDAEPTVTLGVSGSPLAENGGVATVTATLSAASAKTVTVNLAYSGTATNVTDYTRSGASIVIGAGATTGTVTITGVNDATDEDDETVIVDIASVINGTESGTQQVTATISDDDAAPTVTLGVTGSPLAENGGIATVTATLSAASAKIVTVNLSYSGTATNTTDYTRSGTSIVIAAGATSGTVTITGVNDATDEDDETVIVDIASVTNGTESGTQQVTATISDDDAEPGVTLSVSGSPFAENGGVATVTATLAAASAKTVTVNLSYSGTATNTTDYTSSGTSIVIAAGATTGHVTLTGVDDGATEGTETVIVDIASVTNGTETGVQQITASVADDEGPGVALGISGTPLAENGGVATVTATLSATSASNVTVNLAYSGTATNTSDYTRSGTSITILAGNTSGSVTITGVNDALDEDDETVIVDIASVMNGSETGTQQVTAAISDDDAAPGVTLGVSGSPFAENGGVATVTATLSATSGKAVTVNLAYSGTATNTTDYTRSGASILIAAGATTGTVTITGVNDATDEDDESVIVDIASVTNGTESGTQQVTATIADDDAAPTVSLGVTGSPLAENSGIATVTATLSAASAKTVTVNLAYSGTATNTTDYTRSGASIVIAAGATTGTVTITGVNDATDEDDETVIVDIASVTNGTESGTQQVTATISDDDAAPTVTLGVTGSPLAENGGIATVTATLSAASAKIITVNLSYSGTATNTTDYTRSGASIVIAAGATSGTVTITGVNDAVIESAETVIVDIASVTNGTESGTQQVTATIADDDFPTVTLGVSGSPFAENGGVATVTATLSATAPYDVTVNLSYSGTATNVSDYTRSGTAITITAGNTSGTVSLTGVNDVNDEADETVIVDIASVINGTESGTQQVTATISDDDAPPTVTLGVSGSPLAENGGVATVSATLSAASSNAVTVNLAYSGTATNASDYTRSGASIVIAAGNTSGTVTITGVDDATDEDDETVIVDIASVTNGTESGTQQVTATITDDDAAPTVTLGVSGSPLAENGGVATVTATLSAASGKTVTVNLGYTGTATNATDYTRSGTSIVVAAGATTGTVTITGVNDPTDEDDETVIVDIASVTNGTESGTQQVTATISDDDAPPTVTLSAAAGTISENGGATTVTATLSAASAKTVTVNLAYSGTATNASDYTSSGTSIVIAAGATTGTVTITGVDDAAIEGTETVITDIDSVTNGTESGTQQVTVDLADDEGPSVTLGISGSPLAENGGIATVTATLSATSPVNVTVNLSYSGTATNTNDYTRSGTSITVLAGNLTGTATITGVDDALDENDETVIVDIDSVMNGSESGTQQVTATITDDDAAPTVSLGLSGSPLAENGGVATVTATLSAASSKTVTINLAYSGTATNTTDYTRSGASIVIAAGATGGAVTITGVNDALDETDETVIVDIDSVTNGTESGTQQVTATIADDDAAPTVTLGITGSPLAENGGVATVTATLSAASGQNVTVNLAYTGTATNTTDYTRSGASIVIAAGATTGNVTITGVNDALDEADETVIVDVDSVTNGTESGTQQVTATITDDDAAPTVTLGITGSPLAENGGVATVTATLSAASGQTVTVNLAYSGGATNTTDYTRSGASIVIAAGATSGTVTITGVDDALDEDAETVIVDIDSVTNGTESGTQQVAATITDDDAAPTVTLGISGSPLAENGGVATVTATLSAASAKTVTVNLAFTGTATNVSDYTRNTSSIVIAAGATTGTATITGVDDALIEGVETVITDIDSVTNGTESGTQQVTANITDDEGPLVTLGISGSPLAENGGVATVTATLSATTGSTVTVNLAFSGTATNTSDYTRSGASITITAGNTSGSITLTGVNDAAIESAETVIVDIDSVTNATESGTQQVTATITDDDFPTVTLGLSASPFAENGGVATVTATLSATAPFDVTVNLAFSGTATNTTDYSRSGASITITAGNTSGSITLTGVNDALDELDESVIVDIASVTNGTESGTQQVTATITDDDAAPTVTLGVSGSPLAENGGVATVTATLSAASGQTVTVNLAYTGTATNTTDYTRSGASIVIAAGATTGNVTITGVNDALDEADETVIVDIDSVTNGTESGTQQVTATITDDDAAPTVTLGVSGSPLAENGGVATVTATLSAASGQTVTVNLAYTGTATNTTDYTRSGASIVIAAGATTGNVTITGVNDALDEADETVIVDIDSVTNGTESGTQQVTATITDDDAAPTVTLGVSGSPLAENGGVATVTATLSAASGQAVTVNLAFSGTATNATDYSASATGITIAAGATTGSITITGLDDTLDEVNETAIVDISTVTNGTESGTQQVTATITDDDAAPAVTLSVSPGTFVENGGTATLTATLSAVSGQNITVNLAYSGTAANPADYTGAASIVINAGSSSAGITLTGVDDALFEGTETGTIDISSVTNGTESGTQQASVLISDNEFGISSAETLDTDNDGQIDHYRLTFSTSVDDSTFPGYVLNSPGTAQTDWLVAGYTNVVLAHGTSAPEADTVDDAVVYLQFTEGGVVDTGAKPDMTTTASPGLQNLSATTIGQIFTGTLTEADRALPVAISGTATTSAAALTVAFSEAVYGAIGVPACGSGGELDASDLNYTNVSGSGVASLGSMGADSCASDAGFSAIFNGNTIFTTGDNATDTIAATATIFDAADNTGNTTATAISVTAGPTITSVEQYDTNQNGSIDQLKIVFSIAMADSTIADADAMQFAMGGTALQLVDSGTGGTGTISAPNDDSATANDTIVTIFTDDASVTGTDLKTVASTTATGRWQGNGIDLASVADLSSVSVDKAPPVIVTAIASDNVNAFTGVDSDDTLTLNFSEATNKPSVTNANIASIFQLSSSHLWGTVTSAVWNAAGDQLVITFAGSGSTIAVGDRITILGTIQDTATTPNLSTNVPSYNPISGSFSADNVAPYMVTVSNVTPTTVTFRYSEAMITDGSANAANNISNYTLIEDPADAGCADVTIASAIVVAQDTIQLNLTGGQTLCDIDYRITTAANVTDLAGNAIASPNFLTFLGNEQIKVLSAVPISANQIRLYFNKLPLPGNDAAGTAGCTSSAECANRYQISPSLGNITSGVPGTGTLGNSVVLTTSAAQAGISYTIIAANGANGDGFDNASWGAIRNVDDDENLQASPKDRTTFQGLGTTIDEFEDGPLFDDPFGDGSIFSFAFNYGGRVYLGTNDANNAAFRFNPDGSNPILTGFDFSAGTCPGTDGFGFGASPVCGTSSGPNSERGVVGFNSATVTIGGSDYEILLTGPIKDNVSHGYFTQELDTTLGWTEFSLGSYTGGANTKSAQTVYAVDNHLYVAMSSDHNKQAPIVVYHSVTAPGGNVAVGTGSDMSIRTQNGLGKGATGGGSYANPAAASDVVGIDSMVKYNGRLYMANNGGVFYSSNFATFASAVDVTPSAFATTAGDSTLVLPAAPAGLEKVSPGEKGIPILREFNGDLYMVRNVAVGAASNAATNKQNLRGELWRCASPCSAASSWTKLISGTESEIGSGDAISMFEVNGTNTLYLGFDDAAGIQIYRLVSSNPPATNGATLASAGWAQQSTTGLGIAYTKIISSTTIGDGTNDYIYVAAGTGSAVIRIFRQID